MPEIKKYENRNIKLSDIDFNLEALSSKSKKSNKEENMKNLYRKNAMKIQVLMKGIMNWSL